MLPGLSSICAGTTLQSFDRKAAAWRVAGFALQGCHGGRFATEIHLLAAVPGGSLGGYQPCAHCSWCCFHSNSKCSSQRGLQKCGAKAQRPCANIPTASCWCQCQVKSHCQNPKFSPEIKPQKVIEQGDGKMQIASNWATTGRGKNELDLKGK